MCYTIALKSDTYNPMAKKEAKKSKPKKKTSAKSLAVGLAVGAALGTLVGMLFAPKKGSETRKDVEESFYKAKSDVAKHLMKFRNVTQKRYEKAVKEAVKIQEKTAATLKKADIHSIEKKLLSGWKEMERILKKGSTTAKKTVKAATKKKPARRKKKK